MLRNDQIASLGGGPQFARVHWGNPLDASSHLHTLLAPPRLILYSGWSPGDSNHADDTDPRAGRFPLDHRTWMPTTWAALDALCDHLRPHLEALRVTACFRPHARHVLSDPQSCLAFLRRRENQPFEVLLDAAAFLTPAMLPRSSDHLARAMEALAGRPGVAGAILTNLEPGPDDQLRSVPLTQGVLDPAEIIALARRHIPGLPWVILDEEIEGQVRLLEG